MRKIRFLLRLCPRPRWGAYNAPPDPLAVFKGPTSKGREEEEGRGSGVKGKGNGREEEGKNGREKREGASTPPNILA